MDNIIDSPRSESQYNLNERSTSLIADLQEDAFRLSNSHKYGPSFDKWQSIRLLIEARFDYKEKTKLDKLERIFLKRIMIQYPQRLSMSKTIYGLSEREFYIKKKGLEVKRYRLHLYVKFLMELMRAYKIGLTDKQKKTRLS